MKTLSDFKKRLKTGVKLHTVYHNAVAGRDERGCLIFKDEDKGVREVSIVQTNTFALKTLQGGNMVDSYCQYPKASEVQILSENSIKILTADFRRGKEGEMISCLTYTFV